MTGSPFGVVEANDLSNIRNYFVRFSFSWYSALMPDPNPGTCGRCSKDKPCGCGRPTKLTEEFLAAAMEVVNEEDNALIYTDEELVFLINERLPLEARIHGDTFSLWKNGKISDDARAQKFFSVYKKALMKQKRNLFRKMDDQKNPHWQKEAWKIERKFDDWNIKQKIGIAAAPEDGAKSLAAALLGGASGETAPGKTA